MSEPVITINGTRLTQAQAMTIRVAVEMLAMDIHDNGLGDDDTGKAIASGYLKNIREIREWIYQKQGE